MTDLTLGIDIGTSGIRTAVLDPGGAVISQARAAHLPQDPEKIDASAWWQATCMCLTAQGDALAEGGRSLRDVGRICVDGTSGTMVLTDADLSPVTGALMYNSAGFTAEAEVIAQHAPEVHITQGPASALGRALRLQGQSQGATRYLLHQADYIIAKLRGVGGASDYNNALKLGFDPATETWPDWMAKTGLRMEMLPHPTAPGVPLGTISKGVAAELGLSPRTQIHAGTTDSIAAFLAAAPLEPGAAVTSLGTTLAIKILTKTRIDDPAVGLYSHRLGDMWLAGGASNTGGGVLLSVFAADQLAALSESIDPKAESPLDYYPLTKPGERFPINDPDLPPRMTPRPADDAAYLHGLLESIARIEAQCYGAITAQGGDAPRQLFTAGGGAANAVWTRIRARVLGIRPKHATKTEAATGVARLAQQAST